MKIPLADHLLTPQNAALLLIDYQPAQDEGDAVTGDIGMLAEFAEISGGTA